MSLWILKNLTASDIPITLNDKAETIPASGELDLMLDVSLDLEDFVAIKGGRNFQAISDVIRVQTGLDASFNPIYDRKCQLKGYFYEEAMHLLQYGSFKCKDDLLRQYKTVVSHDLTQRKAWYQKSMHYDFTVMTKISDNLYRGDNAPWISTSEGFIYQESKLDATTMTASGNGFKVMVKLNGSSVVMSDYEVNYDNGEIQFRSNLVLTDSDVITCCYYAPSTSDWTLTTKSGYLTRIIKTEVQFSQDIDIKNFLQMKLLIDHPVFGNDFVAKNWEYRGVRDYLSGSNSGFNVNPFGGTENSGFTNGVIVLPFNYDYPLELPMDLNARIVVKSSDDKPLVGSYATVTFYLDEIEV